MRVTNYYLQQGSTLNWGDIPNTALLLLYLRVLYIDTDLGMLPDPQLIIVLRKCRMFTIASLQHPFGTLLWETDGSKTKLSKRRMG